MKRKALNFICFYVGWYACAASVNWVGPAAVAGLVGAQLPFARDVRKELRLLAVALLLGTVIDTVFEQMGIVSYAGGPRLGPLCPLWIGALWVIFASTLSMPATFTCIFDYHAADGTPDWADHRVTLTLQPSEEWVTWNSQDGKEFQQEAFSEFIEENQIDVKVPDGATMLEISQNLQATAGVNFSGKHRLQDGSTAFAYSEQIEATAGEDGILKISQCRLHRTLPDVWSSIRGTRSSQ